MTFNYNNSKARLSLLPSGGFRLLKAALLLLVASVTLTATACAPDTTTDDVETPAEQELDDGTMNEAPMEEVPMDEGVNEGAIDEEGSGVEGTTGE